MIVTVNILKNKYQNYRNALDKIKREVDNGTLIRIKNGLYETNRNVEPYYLASSIFSHSYLSFEWALSIYGLIPERVYTFTSASYNLRKNKTYVNYFGCFEFYDVPKNIFYEGVNSYLEKGYIYKIATKEKTICDCLAKWPVVHSIKQLKILLFEDKRIYENEFDKCDFKAMSNLASLYHKTNLKLLVKLINKEYLHGKHTRINA